MFTDRNYVTAVILAAGKGRRMHQSVPKQFLDLNGHPVLWYSLKAFETSAEVGHMVLVTGKDDIDYCLDTFGSRAPDGFSKLRAVVTGGEERYDSVMAGLKAVRQSDQMRSCQYVMIHDGARPVIDAELIRRCLTGAQEHGASAAGMPSKDTIKICSGDGRVTDTPDRNSLWIVQTPQTFRFDLICEAYHRVIASGLDGLRGITDDAMVAERAGYPVYMCEGAYTNIKITTPEDLRYAALLLSG